MFPTTVLAKDSFLAAGQLLLWLLIYPSAWREYVRRIDPTLSPDFAFRQIPHTLWQHSELRRLRYLLFVIWPIIIGLLIGSVWAYFELIPWTYRQLLSPNANNADSQFLVLGMSYGVVLYLVSVQLSSWIISTAFAVVVSTVGSITIGLILSSPVSATYGSLSILLAILAVSIAGSVISQFTPLPQKTWTWFGSLVVALTGLVVGIMLLSIVLATGAGSGWLVAKLLFPDLSVYCQLIGMAFALGLFLGWYLKRSWHKTLLIAGLLAITITLLIVLIMFVVYQMEPNTLPRYLFAGMTGGSINAIAFIILFAVPYLLARDKAGVRVGVIAGTVSSSSIYLGVMWLATEESTLWIYLGILLFILGLMHKWWLPILFYPFEIARNMLISRQMKKHPNQIPDLLTQYFSLWNEHQRIRLYGLEEILSTVYQHHPALAKTAILQLSNTHQRWAIKASQIESNIQYPARCQTIKDIAQVHSQLVVDDNLKNEGDVGKGLIKLNEISLQVAKALNQPVNIQEMELQKVSATLNGVITFSGNNDDNLKRLLEVAKSWQMIISNHIAEFLQKRELPNPYIFGPPLEDGQQTFVSRPIVDSRIKSLLQDHSSPTLLLYGQRRTGKTSLLKNLGKRLPENFLMMFIDCQGALSAAPNQVSFFYNLIRVLIKEGKRNPSELRLRQPSMEELQSDPMARFDEWLDTVEEAIGGKTLLIALDEFVTLERAFAEKRLDRASLLGMFRNIIQHRSRFRLLFSGTHTFKELQHWANYMIGVQLIHLNYLSDDEAEQLIERPMEYFPLRYAADASQRIKALTHNHPALIQLLCGELVTLKDRQSVEKRLYVQLEDVEAVLPQVFENGGFFFADIEQNQVDDKGRAILYFLATQGEGVVVSQEMLQAQFDFEVKVTLRELLQRELVEEGNGGWHFQVELVRQWFMNKP
jgi:hypothetical protein